jgi:CBS domain-containing protein
MTATKVRRPAAKDRLARDVMQTDVLAVNPEMPLTKAVQFFLEEGIHGAPVLDETERLLGVLSTIDILRAVEEEHDEPSGDRTYFRETLEFSGPDWADTSADFQDRLSQQTVADVMQTSVVTAGEDTPVSEIARDMRANRLHRVLVVRDGTLCGIVTTFDLIALLEA